MEDILYINSTTDVRVKEMVEIIPSKDKELPNLIILTILSAGAGLVTPVFIKDVSGTTIFAYIDEIGTKFILDDKEITPKTFLIIKEHENYFGLLFEDSNAHTLKVSLTDSTIKPHTFENNVYLNKVIIGTSVTSIDDYAFSKCTGLTSVNIGNSVTTIGISAFRMCENLTSVNIPNSVTKIYDHAFNNCGSLTAITIPDSVTSIGYGAFAACVQLENITSLAIIAPTISNNTFQSVKSRGILHVPAGSDYSAWMLSNDYYLGKYRWTKVEDAKIN